MTLRHLPKFDMPIMPRALRWEVAESAAARYVDVQAGAEDNVISMFGAIGADIFSEGVTAKRVSAALRSIKSDEIRLSINSPGGDFFEGVAIYNMLKQDERRVVVDVVGLAASAASVIAMAGDEIRVADSGFLMIHNAWGVVVGNAVDMVATAEIFQKFDASMASLYAARAGIEETEARDMMAKETWMSGKEAVDNGFADSLIPDAKKDTGAKSALRTIESALAAQGMSRSERRRIIAQMTDTPGAVHQAMPSAGDSELSVALSELLQTIKG